MMTEDQAFKEGIIDLFKRNKEGHLGRFCFSAPTSPNDPVCGAKHWSDFISSTQDYYMYLDEAALIQQHAKAIGQEITDAPAFIDLGTGSLCSFERKVIPIIQSAQPETFTFVDICSEFSVVGEKRLQKEANAPKTDLFQGNFWHDLPTPEKKATLNLQGSTLGNCIVDLTKETAQEGLTRTFKHFGSPLRKHGGYFMFTYDSCHNEKAIAKGYDHPSYSAMEMVILHRAKRDLNTVNFNPDDFKHVVLWIPEWHLSAHAVQAKKDASFEIEGETLNVKQGENFRTGSSFKYHDSMVDKAAQASGFNVKRRFTKDGSSMRLAILEVT